MSFQIGVMLFHERLLVLLFAFQTFGLLFNLGAQIVTLSPEIERLVQGVDELTVDRVAHLGPVELEVADSIGDRGVENAHRSLHRALQLSALGWVQHVRELVVRERHRAGVTGAAAARAAGLWVVMVPSGPHEAEDAHLILDALNHPDLADVLPTA